MLTAQNIYDAYARFKSDVTDVDTDVFLDWVQFTTRFIFDAAKKTDPGRFTKSQSYSLVLPPQTESLPTDFQDLNQTVCGLFYYQARKLLEVSFDEDGDTDITFSDSGGTSAYNEGIRVQGADSRGYTGDAAAILRLSFGTNINWTDFDDGGAASPSNDFISLWVYIGNTIPTSVTIEFSTSNTGSDVGVNQLSYTKTGLVAGWNRIKVAKSAFTLTGSAAWTSLGYLRLSHTGGDATTNVYYDKLELVESEVNGKGQLDKKLGVTGYGNPNLGYYLEGSNIVLTGGGYPYNRQILDLDFVMKYIPLPPTIDALADYITVDGTANTAMIVEDRHLEYMVKAVDVLYEQWDDNNQAESVADFRFVRALGNLIDGYNRTPQVSTMKNPSSNF